MARETRSPKKSTAVRGRSGRGASAPLRWTPVGPEHPGRLEAELGYFVLNVEPASNVLVQDANGRWERAKGRAGWIVSVDDGLADPSVPGAFASAEDAQGEAERIARYTLARRPDRERGKPGYALGALRVKNTGTEDLVRRAKDEVSDLVMRIHDFERKTRPQRREVVVSLSSGARQHVASVAVRARKVATGAGASALEAIESAAAKLRRRLEPERRANGAGDPPGQTVRFKFRPPMADSAELVRVMEEDGLVVERPFEVGGLPRRLAGSIVLAAVRSIEPEVDLSDFEFADGSCVEEGDLARVTVHAIKVSPGALFGDDYNYDLTVYFPPESLGGMNSQRAKAEHDGILGVGINGVDVQVVVFDPSALRDAEVIERELPGRGWVPEPGAEPLSAAVLRESIRRLDRAPR